MGRAYESEFELSEVSNTPVMLEVRIRACHVRGSFRTKANQRPTMSVKDALEAPRRDTGRVVLPPAPRLLRSGEGEDREALARRRDVHQGAPAERVRAGRHR